MFNKPNEIGTKLTTVEMMGSGLEMTSEALEKSTEALEMYHEAMNAAVMEAAETELAEDALELTEDEKKVIYTELDRAQKEAWAEGAGYFYWSYKLLTDTVNTGDAWKGWDAWDLGRCVDFGWFEKER